MSNNKSERIFVNYNIRVPQVLCIDQDGTNIGLKDTAEALKMVQALGLDLVQVSPPSRDRPPTCKFIKYDKYKYDLQKKKKEADKKQRESTIKEKEIRLGASTDENDLRIKAKQADEFLEKDYRVKITVRLRGREHRDVAMQTLDTFVSFIPNGGYTKFESNTFLKGFQTYLIRLPQVKNETPKP